MTSNYIIFKTLEDIPRHFYSLLNSYICIDYNSHIIDDIGLKYLNTNEIIEYNIEFDTDHKELDVCILQIIDQKKWMMARLQYGV